MSTSEVHAAIQALYGQNAEQQKAANAFLVQFASTPAAWETALALLGVADPAVQYFGANMLYGKCKSDWATLPEAHRGAFSEAVGTHLSRLAGAPGSSLAARRLCLVMAAAATRAGPAQARRAGDRALALAADAASGASAGLSGVTLALEMQAAIAEETNDAVTVVERQGLVDALVPRLTDVLGTAESVFERISSVSSAAGTSKPSLEGFESLRAAALHAALAWLRLDERGGGGSCCPRVSWRVRAGACCGARWRAWARTTPRPATRRRSFAWRRWRTARRPARPGGGRPSRGRDVPSAGRERLRRGR